MVPQQPSRREPREALWIVLHEGLHTLGPWWRMRFSIHTQLDPPQVGQPSSSASSGRSARRELAVDGVEANGSARATPRLRPVHIDGDGEYSERPGEVREDGQEGVAVGEEIRLA